MDGIERKNRLIIMGENEKPKKQKQIEKKEYHVKKYQKKKKDKEMKRQDIILKTSNV